MSLLIEIEIDVNDPRQVNHKSLAKALNAIAKIVYATEALGQPTVASVLPTELGNADISMRFLEAAQRAQEPTVYEDS